MAQKVGRREIYPPVPPLSVMEHLNEILLSVARTFVFLESTECTSRELAMSMNHSQNPRKIFIKGVRSGYFEYFSQVQKITF